MSACRQNFFCWIPLVIVRSSKFKNYFWIMICCRPIFLIRRHFRDFATILKGSKLRITFSAWVSREGNFFFDLSWHVAIILKGANWRFTFSSWFAPRRIFFVHWLSLAGLSHHPLGTKIKKILLAHEFSLVDIFMQDSSGDFATILKKPKLRITFSPCVVPTGNFLMWLYPKILRSWSKDRS